MNTEGLPTPLVYIIVLNWNGWRMTADCLRSLARLDYPHHRVLVVDNASTDNSVEKLRELFPEQDVLVNEANLGYGGGNNRGIRRALDAGADYVWVLNNDTVVEPAALSAMIAVGETRPDVGAVGAVLYKLKKEQEVDIWGGGRIGLWLGTIHCFKTASDERRLHYLTGASLLLRRATIEEVGLFDEHFFLYWEDTDLGIRIRNAGWKLAVASSARIEHAGSGSLDSKNFIRDYYVARSAIHFFRKHAILGFVPIVSAILGRSLVRALRADWRGMASTWQGAMAGLRIGGGDACRAESKAISGLGRRY